MYPYLVVIPPLPERNGSEHKELYRVEHVSTAQGLACVFHQSLDIRGIAKYVSKPSLRFKVVLIITLPWSVD